MPSIFALAVTLPHRLLAPEFMPAAILGMQVKDMFAEIMVTRKPLTVELMPRVAAVLESVRLVASPRGPFDPARFCPS